MDMYKFSLGSNKMNNKLEGESQTHLQWIPLAERQLAFLFLTLERGTFTIIGLDHDGFGDESAHTLFSALDME